MRVQVSQRRHISSKESSSILPKWVLVSPCQWGIGWPQAWRLIMRAIRSGELHDA
jgi:hypothetical protein